MSAATALPDPAALRLHARDLAAIAAAADRAAARFAAQAIAGIRDRDAPTISHALTRISRAHRAASSAVDEYAGRLEDAAQRRAALDELVDAARSARAADDRLLEHVERLCDELVHQLDDDLARAAERAALALADVTPDHREAGEISAAVTLALDHTGARLLELAGADPGVAS